MSSDAFFPLDFGGIDEIIVFIAGLDGFEGFGGRDEEIAGNESNFGGSIETSICDDVDGTVVGPDVSSVELNHELKGLLGCFVTVFCDILRDEFFELLIDFVVFMVFVHSSDVVEDVLVKNFPQLLVFDVELSQQKLYRADRVQYVFGP